MSAGWEGKVSPPTDEAEIRELAEAPIIARYTAVIGLNLERSDFDLTAAPDDAKSASGLESAPEWTHTPWSEIQGKAHRQEKVSERLAVLALGKLKALLDFGADLPDGSSEQIRDAIDARWPEIAEARNGENAGQPAAAYERIQVEAVVRSSGVTGWGYTLSTSGSPLPGLNVTDPTAPDGFDRYLQNMIRSDLALRLGSFA